MYFVLHVVCPLITSKLIKLVLYANVDNGAWRLGECVRINKNNWHVGRLLLCVYGYGTHPSRNLKFQTISGF